RIDTDARQCFAEVDAGLCDYLGLDARLLAPGPLTRNLRQRKSIEYLNRLLVAQDIQMLCLNVDNEELHQQANALPFAFRHGRHYSEPFQAWPFSSPAC
ncbi:TPA: exotoxin A regulatory protein, partial [Pseudomonas aeruginosa]|nr:exotoxin A regulatory protein [Pseudomonas aeruginosa]HCE5861069.1 exotoxin A regulatory protein [Pseudomonas aeruginosa]HCG0178459.1 exotoxin A regulatory protein [Pseudomonas aeruginosa]HCK5581471.1 exotoxin A regulatory protein [Pseudomonas aeruginosa]HEC1409917.1 exotoxin A regulatory protein [Pseudomonas aeruginosa]